MKSLVWILNSALVILLCLILGYIFFSSKEVPNQPSLRPTHIEQIRERAIPILDQGFLKTIYEENDLFGTYIPRIEIQKSPVQVTPPPQPPAPKPVIPSAPATVSFLEPLKITITGIIMNESESKTEVIISDDATKQQKIYKVGDKIMDAHILRIFKNKIILIRSNGQQETLFINAAEAQAEIKAMQESTWIDVVQKQSETVFIVDSQTFASRITTLAQFIDMLDLMTVFSKGKSIGCRIGKISSESIATALGLQSGDIVTKINEIPTTTTANRVEIYNALRSMELNKSIKIDLIRKGSQIQLEYIMGSLKSVGFFASEEDYGPEPEISQNELIDQKNKLMSEKHKFNPTIHDFRKHDKQAMTHYGSRNSVLKGIPN